MALRFGRLLVGCVNLGVCGLLSGCSIGSFFAEREPWRLEAEVQCMTAGTVKEGAGIARADAIRGPGICGAEYPLRVSILAADALPLGYAGQVRSPTAYDSRERGRRPVLDERPAELTPVNVRPPATLACPMVSELERWIADSVQPASMRWFGLPVVEVKQISAYSCRGMNGSPRARISEHAFGNALDISSFTLADGRLVTVKRGWNGLPEEQGFLRDVQAAACGQFATVLAPGSNVYHYDHIHIDLMRRRSGDRACNPGAVAGEAVAARAAGRHASAEREITATGTVAHGRTPMRRFRPHEQLRERGLPVAEPGEDGHDDD
jgi:hypothetical protein